MNTHQHSTETDNNLLILGIASFFLIHSPPYPESSSGGGRQACRHAAGSAISLCWVCMALFGLHLIAVTALLLEGLRH
ncbi:MAG TPA: hypothetical protein VN673_07515 [Clostridia bacterium]|nr:hypothetical protein [Clostridia bacterium]